MKSEKQTAKKQRLSSYLAERITARENDELSPSVFKTLNRKTFVFNNPEKAVFAEVVALAALADVSVQDLMRETNVGADKITYAQLNKIGFEL